MYDELLSKFGVTFDQLNTAERETLKLWVENLQKQALTVPAIAAHIAGLITAVERDLSGLNEPESVWQWLFRRKRDVYMKARLKNYLMIQDFLLGPERAKKWIDSNLSNLKPSN